MSRTLGFFLGSAVVFALLVIVIGQPVTLAPPTDRNFHSQSATTVTKSVQLPEATAQTITPVDLPAMQTPASASQPTLPPTTQMASTSEQTALAATDTDTASMPAAVTATSAQAEDENSLADQWMATASSLPSASTVDDSVETDAPALPGGNDAILDAATNDVDWFPVWDPFHSELSANAFARRLERITGLDYRVIKTDMNRYRVAMAYSSEDQRMINVAMIEEATGLSVSGGSR